MIKTEFVLVRPPDAIPRDGQYIFFKACDFNTTGYSYFRTSGTEPPMEEWVPTDKLAEYKEAYPYG